MSSMNLGFVISNIVIKTSALPSLSVGHSPISFGSKNLSKGNYTALWFCTVLGHQECPLPIGQTVSMARPGELKVSQVSGDRDS